jgi:transcriptional regulator with XRE-family HTH domain
MKNIGDLLRLKRLEKKYNLEDVAKYVGVSIAYISKLEKGENSNPSDEIIVKLAEFLELDENELFMEFNKIPLSTRNILTNHPELNKTISKISINNKLTDEQKKEYIEKAIYWYNTLVDDE